MTQNDDFEPRDFDRSRLAGDPGSRDPGSRGPGSRGRGERRGLVEAATIVSACFSAAAIAFSPDRPIYLAIAALLAFIACLLRGVAFRKLVRPIVYVAIGSAPMLVATLIAIRLRTDPTPLDGVELTNELCRPTSVFFRALGSFLVFRAIVGRMNLVGVVAGLRRLRFGDGAITFILLSIRHVSLLRSEYDRTIRAMKARGYRPSGPMFEVKGIAAAAGRVFVRSLDRSEQIARAMKCRGIR